MQRGKKYCEKFALDIRFIMIKINLKLLCIGKIFVLILSAQIFSYCHKFTDLPRNFNVWSVNNNA